MSDHRFCPGSKLLRQPAPEMFDCPACGEEVEIWTDEMLANCPSCDTIVRRDGIMSCLEWCKLGKECVGDEAYDAYMRNRVTGLKGKLLDELRNHFGDDSRRISHAEAVLVYAEQILETESADWHIVVPAAILHDVGIKPAEEKYGSSGARLQEQEGPPVAREILLRLGLKLEDIDEICEIIAHHHSPGVVQTSNFGIVFDSDCIVNLLEKTGSRPADALKRTIQTTLYTDAGKKLAEDVLLQDKEHIELRR